MSDPTYVGTSVGRPHWARAAFDVLEQTAARYNGLIVYSDLAAEVQRRTGLFTRANQRNWIGQVLSDVVHRCHQNGLPPLTALVVRKHDGRVGEGYDEVLRTAGLQPIDDQLEREEHAAGARLECYRRYCDSVPAGAKPTLSPTLRKTVEYRRARARPDRSLPICPSCHVELLVTGQCPFCGE